MREGDLIIRDLAYVGLDVLRGIVMRNAYYLCRLKPTVKVYERKQEEYVEFDFVSLRRQMQKQRFLHALLFILCQKQK